MQVSQLESSLNSCILSCAILRAPVPQFTKIDTDIQYEQNSFGFNTQFYGEILFPGAPPSLVRLSGQIFFMVCCEYVSETEVIPLCCVRDLESQY